MKVKMKMNLKRPLFFLMLTLIVVVLAACNSQNSEQQHNDIKPVAVVTISQIGEPLHVIAGEYVDVRTLMGTGVDPHLYQVTPSDIKSLEASQAIIYNGLNLEANMIDVFDQMNKSKAVVAVAEKIDSSKLLVEEDGVYDPHIWFDLVLWEEAIGYAVDAVIELVPEHKQAIEDKEQAYMAQLKALHEQNRNAMSQLSAQSRVLVTAHDAFQYFGRAYEMEVVGLQGLSTESEVSLSTVQDIVAMLVEREIPAVFVESSVNPAAIKAVIDGAAVQNHHVNLGGELFSDAMGPESEETGTYLGMYRHNVSTIVNALRVGDVE